ncbi:hypothetical protein CAter10_4675 [Collimonas arenae]|nr:hypothetical protein CAter10_4675 [Collimonas arenae]
MNSREPAMTAFMFCIILYPKQEAIVVPRRIFMPAHSRFQAHRKTGA